MEYVDNGDMIGAIFFYVRKAFDLVDLLILLKLSNSQWLKSYLNNRQ